MKKIIVLLISIMLLVAGCGTSDSDNTQSSDKDSSEGKTQSEAEVDNGTNVDSDTNDSAADKDVYEDRDAEVSQDNELTGVDKLRKDAVDWADLFNTGNFSKVIDTYEMTSEMNAAVDEAFLENLAVALDSQMGEFVSILGTSHVENPPYDIIYVHTEHANDKYSLLVVFDQDGMIAGLNTLPYSEMEMVPYGEENSSAEEDPLEEDSTEDNSENESVDQAYQSETEVTIGEAYPLGGTLLIPEEFTSNTVVVIVHGSGPSDRDGGVGPNKTYKELAEALSDVGIGSLRFDKRTYVYQQDMAADASLTYYDESVEDAYFAVKYIKEHLDEDIQVVVLGHSLGGHLIPAIADKLEIEQMNADGYVIMAGNARFLAALIPEQIEYLSGLDGSISSEEQAAIDQYTAAYEMLLEPDELEDSAVVMGAYMTYWKALLDYKPLDLVQQIQEPILVVQGERDYQITEQEYILWQEALGDHESVMYLRVEGMNHLLFVGEGAPTNEEYMTKGTIAEAVIEGLLAFISDLN